MKNFILNKITLSCLLIVCIIISLFIGVTSFSFTDLFSSDGLKQQVFWQVRVVRVIALVLAACGMSIAGLIMQQLSQNKFASPTTATTIDGAKLGVMLAIVFLPHNLYLQTIMAFVFSFLTTTGFISFINKVKIKNNVFVPLLGLMLGGIIDSITTFISYQTDQVQNINSWMQANLAHLLKGNYEILYIVIPAVIVAYMYANQFTIIGMGRTFATNLGLNYQRITNIGLFIVAFISATVTISIGTIPFFGLIIPNIASLYYGDKLKNSLVETSLLGAIFILICDIFGRLIVFPYEVPLTLTVGVIGCVIFLMFLFSKKQQKGVA